MQAHTQTYTNTQTDTQTHSPTQTTHREAYTNTFTDNRYSKVHTEIHKHTGTHSQTQTAHINAHTRECRNLATTLPSFTAISVREAAGNLFQNISYKCFSKTVTLLKAICCSFLQVHKLRTTEVV